MKAKFTTVTAITLFSLAALISCNDKASVTVTTEKKQATTEELGQMNRDFAKALLAKDAAAAANLYDENASLLPPGEAMVTGRENIKKYWQGLIDAGLIDAKVATLSAGSDGDLGYETGTFELKLKGEKGDTIVDKGRYTEILKRDASGKWISVSGMWNASEPAK